MTDSSETVFVLCTRRSMSDFNILEWSNAEESREEKALLPVFHITLVRSSQKTSTAVDSNHQYTVVVPRKRSHVSKEITFQNIFSLMN
jgi:hypothetical protein